MFIFNIAKKLKNQRIILLFRQSWSVSWPMTLVMLFLFFIGLSDVYVAGRISKEVQAAYGLATQICFILSIIVFALTVGSVSLISRLDASGEKKDYDITVASSLSVSLASGVAFALGGFLFSRSIINALNVPVLLKGYAVVLLRIYSAGLIFSYFLISSNGILRASGMIRKSLFTMAGVCLLNTLLNFLLAFGTPLGFRGIAVATVVSTFVGCSMNFFFLRRKISELFKFSARALGAIARIGWPAGLMQVLWQVGAMVLFLILAVLPERNIEIMAAFTNGLKIESAIFLPAFAFNMANAVVVGNLLGKKKESDAFLIGIVTAVFGVSIVMILTLLVMLNAHCIASLLSPDAIVVNECVRYIYIALLSEPVMAWGVILGGALNGAGDTKAVMWIVGLSVWLVRLPASYLLAITFKMGAVGVWWAMNLSLLFQAFFMSRRYFKRAWLYQRLPSMAGHLQPVIPVE
ncbi:MAG: MATE family efflux transporter [Omnitrophica WOR_2 bacterium GWF2_43_52]|nr:MAG: MATE family efflux transporter [Omnitrophica WOR_2 bacterium GWA2_44_7]OGX18179.1 MAG: MATE family efflux transporter [Omnitrophica WOR_2 bacterium GWC2_44_8]OGX22628.1 MAG: MATE family efflux transporter [Omnitrophica WOR_2 bacterium GWF2_43_52]OGX55494.1 MAG: MATE family efflux transporter [Omnitrophica WOR_2 bacterium RIFOXYC2_FULL_43_9]HAH21729.1 MATE family efflux transporter [Candidatus Omnitrophota bacterium]